jgi:hypothetical protein
MIALLPLKPVVAGAMRQPRQCFRWRCSLAWRLAAGVPIPAEHAAAYDRARVVA